MITVLYRCFCMQDEAPVEVRARLPDEDIVKWMEVAVGATVYLDHRRRSPNCRAATMEYLKLPAPENAPYLGGEPRLDS